MSGLKFQISEFATTKRTSKFEAFGCSLLCLAHTTFETRDTSLFLVFEDGHSGRYGSSIFSFWNISSRGWEELTFPQFSCENCCDVQDRWPTEETPPVITKNKECNIHFHHSQQRLKNNHGLEGVDPHEVRR